MLEPNFEEADGLGNSLVVSNVKFLTINLFSGTMIRSIKWPFAMPFICQLVVFCIGVLSVVKKQSFAVGHGPRKSPKQKKRQDSQDSESVDEEFESWFEDINQSDKKIPKSQKSRASKKRLRTKHQQQSPQKKRHNSRQSPKKRHDSQKSTKSDSDGLFEGRFEAGRRKKNGSHSPQKKRHNSRQSPSKKRHDSQKSTKSDSDGKFEGRFERKAPGKQKKRLGSKKSTQSDDSSHSGDNGIDPGLQKKRNPSQKSTQSDISGLSDNFGFTLNESAVGFSSQSSVNGSQDTHDSNQPSLYSTQASSDSGEEPDYEFFVIPKMYVTGKKKRRISYCYISPHWCL